MGRDASDVGSNDRLSKDGRLLVGLLLLVLVGPYLPLLDVLKLVEIDVGEGRSDARLDNIAVPLVAGFLVLRSLLNNRLIVNPTLLFHAAFLVWLAVITVFYLPGLPGEYAGSETRGVGLLRGIDAYYRPIFVLIIGLYARTTPHDLKILVQIILAIGALMGIVAAMQLTDATKGPTNDVLYNFFDNNSNTHHFWGVVDKGRAAAFMPQLSTLGMYTVLSFGLLAAQVMGGRAISSPLVYGLIVAGVTTAGIMSGSKVFFAGVVVLGFGLIFFIGTVRRESLWKFLAAGLALVLLLPVLFTFYPDQSARAVSRVSIPSDTWTDGSSAGSRGSDSVTGDDRNEFILFRLFGHINDKYVWPKYNSYLATRFDENSGKLYRTGAVDVASDYPVTGLGLSVVNRTTDSMSLGIVIMSGAIGSVLYLAMALALVLRLLHVTRNVDDPDVAAIARVMVILTLVFLAGSVAFHTLIQDRAGDAYWLLAGMLIGPLMVHRTSAKLSGQGKPSA